MRAPILKIVFQKNLDVNSKTPSFGDEIVIDDMITSDTEVSLEVKRDTTTLRIPNFKRRSSAGTTKYSALEKYHAPNLSKAGLKPERSLYPFQAEDRIKIFSYYNGESQGSPIYDGIIFDVDYSVDVDNSGTYDIQLANRTQELMHSQQFANFDLTTGSATETNAAEIIKTIVRRANQINPNSKRISALLDTEGGFISTTKRDGSPLKTDIIHKTGYQSLYKHVLDLSGVDFTGDEDAGAYVFYIDENQNLHWGPRSAASTGTVNESDFTNYELNINNDDVVNAYIINAGGDPNNNGILTFVIDTKSATEVGTRFRYVPRIRIAEIIQLDERSDGADINGANAIPDDSNFPAGYPYTLQFDKLDFTGALESPVSRVVNSDTEYVEAIRNKVRAEAKKVGRSMLKITTTGRYESSAELQFGRKTDTVGDLVNHVAPSYNIQSTSPLQLRLTNIKHNWSRNGWVTTLEYKEDEETVS